jgi:L-threonylcarbamoyladenylate synthase
MPIVTLAEAAKRLKAGDVVAIPTETVYGLAADAANPKADRKSTRLNSSHRYISRMPSSA